MLATWMKLLPVWLIELIVPVVCEKVPFKNQTYYNAFKNIIVLKRK